MPLSCRRTLRQCPFGTNSQRGHNPDQSTPPPRPVSVPPTEVARREPRFVVSNSSELSCGLGAARQISRAASSNQCQSAHPAAGHEHPIARMQNPPRGFVTEPRPISLPMAATPHVIAASWAPRPIAGAPDVAGTRSWSTLEARRRRWAVRSDRRACFGLGRHDCGGERRSNRGGQESP